MSWYNFGVREVEVEFAVRDGAHIAYEVFGSGPVDLLVSPGSAFPIDLMWDLPQLAEFMEALGRVARVIAFDGRGQGASDPIPTADGVADIEAQASDVLSVMDAAGSDRASMLCLHSAPQSLLFAATYPQRVRSLIIPNVRSSFPELQLLSAEERAAAAMSLTTPLGLRRHNPRLAHDPVLQAWWGRAHRLGRSRQESVRQLEWASQIDIGAVLEQLRTPTLVFHRSGNQVWDLQTSRDTAAKIPNARFVELPGSENDIFLGDTSEVLAQIVRFLREPEATADVDDRQLATVLFTDIVASTERLAEVGDQAWRTILDDHDRTIDQIVSSHRGRVVNRQGDGMLATFDGPARAVRCAGAIRDQLAADGMAVRAGLHTGEIELRGDDVAGLAVHTGARVAALAGAGEVLVSSTVKDLVAGAGIEFTDRGEHELRGVPGTWRIYAVAT